MPIVKAEKQVATICLLMWSLIVCRRAAAVTVAATVLAQPSTDAFAAFAGDIYSGEGDDAKLCYYDSSSFLISGEGHFQVDDIDPFICTHVVYSSVGMDFRQTLVHRKQYQDMRYGDYSGLMRLKRKNQHLKVMFSLNIGQPQLSYALAHPARIHRLVNNTFEFMKTYLLDGVDVALTPAQPIEKWLLNDFMRTLREKLGRKRLISLTVPSDQLSIEMGYDFPKLNRYVDLYNFFAFTMNAFNINETTFRMPLRNSHRHEQQVTTVEDIVKYMIGRGAQSTKILLGVELHARTFVLNSTLDTDLYAPVIGPDSGGSLTSQNGSLSFTEVCMTLNEGGWTIVFNEEMAGVYAYRGDQWMTYETPRTMKGKHRFAREMRLGGMMVWSIDADDMDYVCGPRNLLLDALWLDDLRVLQVD